MADYIDAQTLRKMFLAGVAYLEKKKEWINELNVFPVPDGDTGTNMTLTLMSAVKDIRDLSARASMHDIGQKIASGTLRGARGNSGVIMSQLCRGFVKGFADVEQIDRVLLSQALQRASATAYKAVMKPKEGTILTVARVLGEKAKELENEEGTLEDLFRELFQCAQDTLAMTPEMLPVLKEAGVVDSGGQGLVEFLRGAQDAFLGLTDLEAGSEPEGEEASASQPLHVDTSHLETADIKFVYCTEFIIESDQEISEEAEEELRTYLSSIGDSLVCVSMDSIIKIHVHTNHPGEAIEKALTYGQLTNLKIDNMRFEHNERLIRQEEKPVPPSRDYGFISVCSGAGLKEIFESFGVDRVIEGGQTMNPSTEDILAAASAIPARTVFVLPNNGNIILAANQARDLCVEKELVVIPTRNICQGISAMIAFAPDAQAGRNTEEMTRAAQATRSGEVTYAVRNTRIDGSKIKKGDYMGIGNGQLLSVARDINTAVLEMTARLAQEDTQLITVYYGEDPEEEEVRAITKALEEKFPDADVETVFGGQSVYSYFISAE